MVWYFHLSKNFPQFVVIHTIKDFGIVNKAEVVAFLEISYFFDEKAPLPFLKPAFTSGNLLFMCC